MDFLEIRRKAKERAETRARAAAQAEAPRADPSPSAGAATHSPPEERPVQPAYPELPSPNAPALESELAQLDSLESVAKAIAEVGGKLTAIPDLPPWGSALESALSEEVADEPARDPDAAAVSRSAPDAPAPLWSAPALPPAPSDPLDEFFYREDETAPGLPDLDFAVPAIAAPVEVADPIREYLTFFLGFEEYAIDIESVREVLKAPVVTDVPRAPRHVLGVIIIRGDVIAVFEPRRRLGLPEIERLGSPRVLVCDDGQGPIGLLVDAVSQVVRLRASEIEPRPQGIGSVSAEYISGIGRQDGRMFIVLDLPVVLRGKQAPGAEAHP